MLNLKSLSWLLNIDQLEFPSAEGLEVLDTNYYTN